MMFLELIDLAGQPVLINSRHFVRARNTYGVFEPEDATVLQLTNKRIACQNGLEEIAQMLSRLISTVEFHLPMGASVWLSVDKITDVKPKSDVVHHPSTNAIIALENIDQQVQETVAEVRDALSRLDESSSNGT